MFRVHQVLWEKLVELDKLPHHLHFGHQFGGKGSPLSQLLRVTMGVLSLGLSLVVPSVSGPDKPELLVTTSVTSGRIAAIGWWPGRTLLHRCLKSTASGNCPSLIVCGAPVQKKRQSIA